MREISCVFSEMEKNFGLKQLSYRYQEGEGGIAAALSLAETFAAGDAICVILGDNIYENSLRKSADEFARIGKGARIHLKQVENPQRFGVPVMQDGRIIRIEEKPQHPQSNFAVYRVLHVRRLGVRDHQRRSSLQIGASLRSPT
jgi:glucose-1-phosphate thymidylyltransferase